MDFVEYFRFFFLHYTTHIKKQYHRSTCCVCCRAGRIFCTLANLFTGRQKVVKDFLTAPLFFLFQRLHCLLSDCCRQFLFVDGLVL